MAIYGDKKHDNGVITNFRKKDIMKVNKDKLITEVIKDMFEDTYNWEDYMRGLCIEALQKRTQKELKHVLGYNK